MTPPNNPKPPAPYESWRQMYEIGISLCFHLTNPAVYKHGTTEYSWPLIQQYAAAELLAERQAQAQQHKEALAKIEHDMAGRAQAANDANPKPLKTPRDYIQTIHLVPSNLRYIAENHTINGTLMLEIERVMNEYANAISEAQAQELESLRATNIEQATTIDRQLEGLRQQSATVDSLNDDLRRKEEEARQSRAKIIDLEIDSAAQQQHLFAVNGAEHALRADLATARTQLAAAQQRIAELEERVATLRYFEITVQIQKIYQTNKILSIEVLQEIEALEKEQRQLRFRQQSPPTE